MLESNALATKIFLYINFIKVFLPSVLLSQLMPLQELLQYRVGARCSSQFPSRESWGSHAKSWVSSWDVSMLAMENDVIQNDPCSSNLEKKRYCFCFWLLWRIHRQRADKVTHNPTSALDVSTRALHTVHFLQYNLFYTTNSIPSMRIQHL